MCLTMILDPKEQSTCFLFFFLFLLFCFFQLRKASDCLLHVIFTLYCHKKKINIGDQNLKCNLANWIFKIGTPNVKKYLKMATITCNITAYFGENFMCPENYIVLIPKPDLLLGIRNMPDY